MQIVICEDKPEDAFVLRSFASRYFKEINYYAEIAVYKTGDSFLADLGSPEAKDVKLAFLDILMPGTDGIEVARKIREIGEDTIIVFVTTSLDYLLEGYSVHAYHYLLKPVTYPDVAKILGVFVKQFACSLRFIEVISDRSMLKIWLKDIVYVESFSNVLLIHTVSDAIKCYRLPLGELERRLEGGTFLRASRSYVVNMRYIKELIKDDFLMTDGKTVPIGRNNKTKIKQTYSDYLSSLLWGM